MKQILSLLCLFFICSSTHGQLVKTIPPIPNETLEIPLKSGETHTYKIKLKKRRSLHLNIEEKGIDINLILRAKGMNENSHVSNFGSGYGRETLTVVNESVNKKAKEYELLVIAQKQILNGSYKLQTKIIKQRNNEAEERKKATELLTEGKELLRKESAKFKRQAIPKFKDSIILWNKLKESYWEAYTLNLLGNAHRSLNEPENSLEFFNKSRVLSEAINDKEGTSTAYNNIGDFYRLKGKHKEALESYRKSLILRKSLADKLGEAKTLNNIGSQYFSLKQKEKALEHHKEALVIKRLFKDTQGVGLTLINIGTVYNLMGEKTKAIEAFDEAFPLIVDKNTKGELLLNMGAVNASLGNLREAAERLNEAISLFKEIENKRNEINALLNLAAVYYSSNNNDKAIQIWKRFLPLVENNADAKGTILNNLGLAYRSLGKNTEALENFNKALLLSKELGYSSRSGKTLSNIGLIHGSLGEIDKSLKVFHEALPYFKQSQDKIGEAKLIDNIMFVWGMKNKEVAIFFGKYSFNMHQKLRSELSTLNKTTQKNYLKTIEQHYRNFAQILFSEGKTTELFEALNAFKDQSFFDFEEKTSLKPLKMNLQEQMLFVDYAKYTGKIATIRSELTKSVLKKETLDSTEKQKLEELRKQLESAEKEYVIFLQSIEKRLDAKLRKENGIFNNSDLKLTQKALKTLSSQIGNKVAIIYPFITKDTAYSLLVTDETASVSSYPIKRENLRNKILQFRRLLLSPSVKQDKITYDPKPIAQELYKIIFAPIASKMPKNTKTILWALDDSLRYVPMSALHDGDTYLVEKYQNVLFTRKDEKRLLADVNRNWVGLGLGTVKEHEVENNGKKIKFDKLRATQIELNRIFGNSKSIFNGDIFIDEKFNRLEMLKALKLNRPLVHISSHFNFVPGSNLNSFLLLGDGNIMNLSEFQKHKNLFGGVELLTLSACETAAQRPNSDGREIDAFAELAQRLGAKSVLATLWKIDSNSTVELTTNFYKVYKNESLTKAEALQKSQLSLLKGEIKESSKESRPISKSLNTDILTNVKIDKDKLIPFIKDENAPFAHPYYWAPFVLYGNLK